MDKSNIKEYQYFVYQGDTLICSSNKITDTTWSATGLTAGVSYDIYVNAYDNAGNITTSENIDYIKLEVYKWNKYYSKSMTIYTYSKTGTEDLYVSPVTAAGYSYPGISSLRNCFDKTTGKWTSDKGIRDSEMKDCYIILGSKNSNGWYTGSYSGSDSVR